MSATTQTPGRGTPPALAPWVELNEEPCHGGRRYIVAVNHRDGIALRLSETEAAMVAAANDGSPLSGVGTDEGGRALFDDLWQHGFLTDRPTELDAPPVHRSWRQRLSSVLRTLDVSTTRADVLVRAAHRRFLHHLFTPVAAVIQMALAAAGVFALAGLLTSDGVELRATPAQIPVFIVLGLAASFVHELGHAVVLVHYDRSVRAVGLKLHLGNPAFYVDSLDGLLLSRRQRIVQAAAGPWAEWLFTSVIALAGLVSPLEALTVLLVRFTVVNTFAVVSNLLPFVGLDGQLLLADAVRQPDLPERSKAALTGHLRNQRSRAESRLLVIYAALNTLVAGALILVAGFFWHQLFGDLVATLIDGGPIGWLTLAVLTVILAGPLAYELARRATSATPALRDAAIDQWHRARFRLERRLRIAAITNLARLPQLAGLDHSALGILAGHLQFHRVGADGHLPVRRPAFATVCPTTPRRPAIATEVIPAGPPLLRAAPGTRVAVLESRWLHTLGHR